MCRGMQCRVKRETSIMILAVEDTPFMLYDHQPVNTTSPEGIGQKNMLADGEAVQLRVPTQFQRPAIPARNFDQRPSKKTVIDSWCGIPEIGR